MLLAEAGAQDFWQSQTSGLLSVLETTVQLTATKCDLSLDWRNKKIKILLITMQGLNIIIALVSLAEGESQAIGVHDVHCISLLCSNHYTYRILTQAHQPM